MADAFDDMTVSEIMTRWPQTVRVFLDLRLLCVGCPIGGFHTLVDAAEEHGIALELLEEQIRDAIDLGTTMPKPDNGPRWWPFGRS
jgi:hybrid cluster-associated redox disulfide protein